MWTKIVSIIKAYFFVDEIIDFFKKRQQREEERKKSRRGLPKDLPVEQESIEEIEEQERLDKINDLISSYVTFIVTKDGNIDVSILWNDNSEDTAKNLAYMLYLINSGDTENAVANLLVGMAAKDPSNTKFIKTCIDEWNKKKKKEPLVKPSEVFQFGNVIGSEQEQ